jgi:hypothetical protein
MVKYDQKDFLKQCVSRFIELTGKHSDTLKRVETPFIDITAAKALDEDNHEEHRCFSTRSKQSPHEDPLLCSSWTF